MEKTGGKYREMKFLLNNKLLFIVRLVLAAVFLYAGLGKIYDPGSFAQDIDNYRILPYVLVTLMAVILPWIEVICGFMLIIGKWNKGTGFIVSILNIIFIIAISSALIRGLDISCGCFATFGEGAKAGIPKLVQDALLLGGSLLVFYHAIQSKESLK